MKASRFDTPRARRVAVPVEPFIGGGRYDYADAFEIRVDEPDERSAEELVRFTLEQAPRWILWIIRIAHRYVLRFRLGPESSPLHVLGWSILSSAPNVLMLRAVSPVLKGVIVARKPEPTRAVVTTYVFFRRPATCRALLKVVGPVHRKVAPYLLECGAAARGRGVASPIWEAQAPATRSRR
jgi:hypothetical protein